MYCDITPHFVGVEIVVLDTGRHEPCLLLGSEEISYKKIRMRYSRKIVAIGASSVEKLCKGKQRQVDITQNTNRRGNREYLPITDLPMFVPLLFGVRVVDGYRVTAKFSGIDKLLDSFLDRSRWLPVLRVQAKIL